MLGESFITFHVENRGGTEQERGRIYSFKHNVDAPGTNYVFQLNDVNDVAIGNREGRLGGR